VENGRVEALAGSEDIPLDGAIKKMASPTNLAHPIRTLQEQAEALEKALAASLSDASSEAIHKLRTKIRRFEAQLTLITQSRKLPGDHHECKKLLRHLKRLRRSAGKLRDLDVQCHLITAHLIKATARDARLLRRSLKYQRDQQSVTFLNLAQRLKAKVSKELSRLLSALSSADNLELPVDLVISSARRWFTTRSRSSVSEDHLHAIRKAAKIARYMCETVPGSAAAQRIASQFENIQDKGGEWHDWLEVTRISRAILGRKNPLIEIYKEVRDSRLMTYRRELMNFHATSTVTK
jgi:CHAD domain-containing protein